MGITSIWKAEETSRPRKANIERSRKYKCSQVSALQSLIQGGSVKEMMKPSWHTGKQAGPAVYCQLCFRELSTGALHLGSVTLEIAGLVVKSFILSWKPDSVGKLIFQTRS